MPDLTLEYHRLKTPIDHPDQSVTRAKLEYPTVDVSFAYLAAIGKVNYVSKYTCGYAFVTSDAFGDKAVWAAVQVNTYSEMMTRVQNFANHYYNGCNPGATTADHYLYKLVNGTSTALATEAIDIDNKGRGLAGSCSGSTIKSLRYELTSPVSPLSLPAASATISATDTTFASGLFGARFIRETYPHGGTESGSAWLKAPLTALPTALLILEVEVEGSGKLDDSFRPSLSKNLVEVSSLAGLPDFLYWEARRYEVLRSRGFTDEEVELLLGHVPQHQVDLDAVTWGAFEFSEKSPTNIIVVTGDNPYRSGAIERQRARAKRVFAPPRGYGEAVALYNKLKGDFPHWLAGKDSFAYQVLGWEELDVFQNVDFYYGELIEHKTHYDQLKQAPSWEIEGRLLELKARLEKMAVLPEERDKHLKKVEELLKKGW
jgi:hypothetical protein